MLLPPLSLLIGFVPAAAFSPLASNSIHVAAAVDHGCCVLVSERQLWEQPRRQASGSWVQFIRRHVQDAPQFCRLALGRGAYASANFVKVVSYHSDIQIIFATLEMKF